MVTIILVRVALVISIIVLDVEVEVMVVVVNVLVIMVFACGWRLQNRIVAEAVMPHPVFVDTVPFEPLLLPP